MTTSSSHFSAPLKYRPDIDGLRAVSVILVVAFHAFPELVPGGFIGVDIFFVISGYLISKIIFEDLQAEKFSFLNFYQRRIRRIFPTLLPMLFGCYIFGWFSLFSSEYMQLGKHLAGGSAFISNLINWSEEGYFNNSAETKPLIHLWSLGIEEQFYLFWPLILWVAWKRKINLFALTLGLAIFSFFMNLRIAPNAPTEVFFSPMTRIWELLAGGLLAWYDLNSNHLKTYKSKFVDDLKLFLSICGLFLLCFSLSKISKDINFPGKWGVPPVLAALFIISSGPNNWINKNLLSNRALVFIGLLSFPIYIWHWPLLSFAVIIEDGNPSALLKLVLVFIALILAWLSYRFLEVPIRFGRLKRISIVELSIPMALIGVVGWLTYSHWGLPFRRGNQSSHYQGDVGHLDFHRHVAENFFPCKPEDIQKESLRWEGFVRCAQSKPSEQIDVAILGDSHAEHLFLGIADKMKEQNVAFYIKNEPAFASNPQFKNVLDFVSENKTIKTVILTMYWKHRKLQVPADSDLKSELTKTIEKLSKNGKQIFLTDDVPDFPFDAKQCKQRSWLSKKEALCEFQNRNYPSDSNYLAILKELALERPNVHLIETERYFQTDNLVKMTRGRKLLFRDNHHLNIEGSLFLGRKIIGDNKSLFSFATGNFYNF